jgi:preprotein translocase subunit SecA
VSLEDELVAVYGGSLWRRLSKRIVRRAQRRAERIHARMRRDLLKVDDHLETALAFSGHSE